MIGPTTLCRRIAPAGDHHVVTHRDECINMGCAADERTADDRAGGGDGMRIHKRTMPRALARGAAIAGLALSLALLAVQGAPIAGASGSRTQHSQASAKAQ